MPSHRVEKSRREERPKEVPVSKRTIGASIVVLSAATWAHAGVNTWTALGPEGGDVREVVMHPTQPDTAVAIAYSGVYRTTDGAVAWTQSAHRFHNPPYDLQVDPSDPNRVYVFSFSTPHIVVSSDGGVTFGPLTNLPVTNAFEPRLGLGTGGRTYFGADLRVFRSDDTGASWTEVAQIVLPSGARIRSLVVDPMDRNTVYAAAGADASPAALFVSRDAGQSWEQRSPAGAVVPHPTASGELWSARADGLWRSQDYGASWTNVAFPNGVYDVALTMPGSALDVIASTFDGVFRSLDGGDSWSSITGDLGPSLWRVAAHGSEEDRIILSGQGGIMVPGASAGIWVPSHSGIIATRVQTFAVDASSDRIYAHTGSIHVSASGAAYVPVDDRPLATIGTGPLPKLMTTIHAQPGTLLALLSNELARSDDGAASWNLIPGFLGGQSSQLWQLASAAADPQNLIAAGRPAAFRSANGGASWTPIVAGLPDEFGTFDIEFAESDPSVVYFGPYQDSMPTPIVYGVYRSTDGGTTWVPADTGIADLGAYDIEVDPTDSRIVYAIAGTTFVKSVDSGTTWRTLRQSLTSSSRIAIDPVIPRVVYVVSYDNLVLRSVDGGESFEAVVSPVTIPWWHPRSVVVDPRRSNVVNVGTDGFGVQQMSVEPDLELRLTQAPAAVSAGTTLSYLLFATNRGPFASSGSRVEIELADGMNVATATSQGGSCTAQRTSAVCTLNPLAANASIGITLTAIAPTSGSAAVSASLQGDQPDPVMSDNAVSHSIDVTPPGTPPVAPPPPAAGGGGGGGGGGMSLLLLLLACFLRRLALGSHVQSAARQ
jgi:photosystem II stability/assembly factor-like uncharacterized protein